MEKNQDEIRAKKLLLKTQNIKYRDKANLRFVSQKKVAVIVSLTNIFFNSWLRGHRDLSEKALARVKNWLAE